MRAGPGTWRARRPRSASLPDRRALLEESLYALLRIFRVMDHVTGHRLERDQGVGVGIEAAVHRHLGHPHAEWTLVDQRCAEVFDQLIELALRGRGIDQS